MVITPLVSSSRSAAKRRPPYLEDLQHFVLGRETSAFSEIAIDNMIGEVPRDQFRRLDAPATPIGKVPEKFSTGHN